MVCLCQRSNIEFANMAGDKKTAAFDFQALQENEINSLADRLEESLQMDSILALVI